MPSSAGIDPSEVLYRRISLRANPPLLHPGDEPAITQKAFQPSQKHDHDGISLIRGRYRDAAEAAAAPGSQHQQYVLAVVRAGDLMQLGLTLDPTPDELDRQRGGIPAHVSVRELNSNNYRDPATRDLTRRIAENLIQEVIDPLRCLPQD